MRIVSRPVTRLMRIGYWSRGRQLRKSSSNRGQCRQLGSLAPFSRDFESLAAVADGFTRAALSSWTAMSLTSEFTSTYRLFLRACSASVLHKGPSKLSLIRLYRPSFDAAAGVVLQLQRLSSSSPEATRLQAWLADFDIRGEFALQRSRNC